MPEWYPGVFERDGDVQETINTENDMPGGIYGEKKKEGDQLDPIEDIEKGSVNREVEKKRCCKCYCLRCCCRKEEEPEEK